MRKVLALVAPFVLLAAVGPNSPNVEPIIYQFDGSDAGDVFGESVAGVGDVNGDGHDDVAIGALLDDNFNKQNSGSVTVYSGKTGKQIWQFNGDLADDQLGRRLARVGDVNKDGIPDILTSSSSTTHKTLRVGSARVYSGKDGKVLHTFYGTSKGTDFGESCGGAGDVNGDGHADVVVGSPRETVGSKLNAGSATVFSGKDGKILRHIPGNVAQLQFGQSVAGAGDVNKDGYADVVIGTIKAKQASGMVTIYSGKDWKVLHTIYGESVGDSLGESVAGGGDINGDGHADVLAGATGDDNTADGAGSVNVICGKTGKIVRTLDGEAKGDQMGFRVFGAGDANNDGVPDIGCGTKYNGKDNRRSGMVRVWSGKDGAVLHTAYGTGYQEYLGSSAAGAGDVDNDGFDDFVAGATGADPNKKVDAGSAWVFSGAYGVPVFKSFGTGCSSTSPPPAIASTETPRLGQNFSFTVTGFAPNKFGGMIFGWSDKNWGLIPLPLKLAVINANNCSLYVSMDVISLVVTDSKGTVTAKYVIPSDNSVVGLRIFGQAYAPDAKSNGLGIAMSNAAKALVGW